MERRRFLAAAPIVYNIAAAPASPLKAAATPNSAVNLGFIGVGIRGTQLFREFQAMPNVNLVAAADLYNGCLERVKEETEGKIKTAKDYRTILDNKDVDAVVIATPDHHHHRMTLDALAAGKHVYIEKPMAWSIEQCRDIVAASEKRPKQILAVGSSAKTSAQTAAARDIIKSGILGKVNQIRMENHRNSPEGAWIYPVPPDASPDTIDWQRFIGNSPKKAFDANIFFRWRCWWEYSGGVATDLFVHLLTGLHEFMGVDAPKSVVSQGGIYRWNDGRTVPDLMQSVFDYGGFLAEMHVNLGNLRGSGQSTLIHGSEGTLSFEGRRRLVVYPEPVRDDVQSYGTMQWPKAARAKYFESKGYTAEGRPKNPPAPPKPAKEITWEQKAGHTELFILAVRDSGPSPENAFAGYAAAGSAHLANLAFRRGRRMSWDVKTGKISG